MVMGDNGRGVTISVGRYPLQSYEFCECTGVGKFAGTISFGKSGSHVD